MEIDLSTLSFPQLNSIKCQLDQEVQFLASSMSKLKAVQQKFVASKESVTKLSSDCSGKEVMIPLTSSMYVPGRFASSATKVLVDIGTGYFVEKTFDEACAYFDRKIEFLTKQLEEIQVPLIAKSKNRDAVANMIQIRVQQLAAAQAQLKGKN
ncbi:prefoldin subunit 5-like [Oscarella lobularis]|uniref:prefoldin subunit 5-like n=1 Tax=Oscarella lobularis TaxID=121494 RepID=UPI003313503D